MSFSNPYPSPWVSPCVSPVVDAAVHSIWRHECSSAVAVLKVISGLFCLTQWQLTCPEHRIGTADLSLIQLCFMPKTNPLIDVEYSPDTHQKWAKATFVKSNKVNFLRYVVYFLAFPINIFFHFRIIYSPLQITLSLLAISPYPLSRIFVIQEFQHSVECCVMLSWGERVVERGREVEQEREKSTGCSWLGSSCVNCLTFLH